MKKQILRKSKKNYIKSAFILGSTSLVAQSICIELAEKGCKKFHLLARNLELNHKLFLHLTNNYGADVIQEEFNLLSNSCILNSSLPKIKDFDLYLITAGSIGDDLSPKSKINDAHKITEINYSGILPWITAITSEERIAKEGRLWVFSSVAGDIGRPSNYHYGAAKSALSILCQGLLYRCNAKPFSIRLIKAGYLATPPTLKKASPLLCTKTSKVAKILLKNPNRRGIEYLPWWWSIIMTIIKFLPSIFISKL